MLPKWHILIGFVFSYLLVYFFHFSIFAGTIIFLSSWFLIDLDHYLRFISKSHKLSAIQFWKWSLDRGKRWKKLSREQKKEYKQPIFIFHGIEFILILIVLSYFFEFFIFVIIGVIIHLLADYIDILAKKEFFHTKMSQIYTYITNKNKKELNL